MAGCSLSSPRRVQSVHRNFCHVRTVDESATILVSREAVHSGNIVTCSLVTLTSVCDHFYEVVSDRRFQRLIRRSLEALSTARHSFTSDNVSAITARHLHRPSICNGQFESSEVLYWTSLSRTTMNTTSGCTEDSELQMLLALPHSSLTSQASQKASHHSANATEQE